MSEHIFHILVLIVWDGDLLGSGYPSGMVLSSKVGVLERQIHLELANRTFPLRSSLFRNTEPKYIRSVRKERTAHLPADGRTNMTINRIVEK